MYTKIVVPLDGSELAETSLNYASQLTAKSGAELILLHVCGPDECHCGPEGCRIQPMHEAYIEHTVEVLKRRLQEFGNTGANVNSAVLAGDPAQQIVDYAEENKVGLIVMTTHGQSALRKWVMGSVATKIHRCSNTPVRLVRALSSDEAAPEDWPEKKILVLLDGSERAEQVLPYVIDHAKMSNSDVTLLRVYEPPTIPSDYPFPDWYKHVEMMIAYQQEQCSLYLENIEKRLKETGLNVKSECVLGYNASQEVIDYATKSHPNLIAMTTHARCALSVWPIGSTADKVIHGTSSPILLVRPSELR